MRIYDISRLITGDNGNEPKSPNFITRASVIIRPAGDELAALEPSQRKVSPRFHGNLSTLCGSSNVITSLYQSLVDKITRKAAHRARYTNNYPDVAHRAVCKCNFRRS